MITKEEAVKLVENKISRTSCKTWVTEVTDYDWGWIVNWESDPILYGTSNFLVHKNGKIASFNEMLILPEVKRFDVEGAIALFVEKAGG